MLDRKVILPDQGHKQLTCGKNVARTEKGTHLTAKKSSPSGFERVGMGHEAIPIPGPVEALHGKTRAVSPCNEGGGASICFWRGRERAVPHLDADDGALQRLPGSHVLRDVQPCSHSAGGSADARGRIERRGIV